jgi:hypothetical protein
MVDDLKRILEGSVLVFVKKLQKLSHRHAKTHRLAGGIYEVRR